MQLNVSNRILPLLNSEHHNPHSDTYVPSTWTIFFGLMTFFVRYFYISYELFCFFFCVSSVPSVHWYACVCVVVPVYPSYPVIVCCSSDQPSNVCNILFGYFVFFHFSFTVIVVTLTAAAIPMLYTPNISKKRTKPLLIFTKCF